MQSVIEGLTGHTPEIQVQDQESIDQNTNIMSALALVTINSDQGGVQFALDVSLATVLGDLMLGGEGEEQEEMSEDDLDATKEIVSNIFGAIATTLSGQEDLPSLSFEIDNIKFLEDGSNFEGYSKLYKSKVKIANTEALTYFLLDDKFMSNFESEEKPDENIEDSTNNLTQEELKNMELLLDVPLPIRVRIGTKVVLLKDVINMDIGSVVELDQLASEPLDILVGDKIIAKGEVVIVDGNFGVQIVEIGSQREILSKLR
jgi:flagellar motor switch protein FliN/FliY